MYQVYLGDYAYSSWSLRAWLLFRHFDLPMQVRPVELIPGTVADQMADMPLARFVPSMIAPDGTQVSDSVAIAEELASRHPEAGLWPEDPKLRGLARTLVAEMHVGFGALRNECAMNLFQAYDWSAPSKGVLADVQRLELLWAAAREASGGQGPWLFGRYSIADAFYAPVALRIAGYNLPVSEAAKAYVNTHLADGHFQAWRDEALAKGVQKEDYLYDYPKADWPFDELV